MTRADMDRVRDEFVLATHRAAECGFDLLELHMAHGYLLSSFLSPLTNRRAGRVRRRRSPSARASRSRCSTRAARPGPRRSRCPCASRRPTGIPAASRPRTPSSSRGCCASTTSTSSTSRPGRCGPTAKPAFGRSFQTPFADRIRNEVDVPTIAVGAISSYDDVNTTILAGRADLCALGRPHLYDPYWTLHAAAEQGYGDTRVDRPVPGGQPAADGRPPRRAQAAAAVVRSRRRAPAPGSAGSRRPPDVRPRPARG